MQYLTKNPDSQAITLKYTNKTDRIKIREILLRTEQKDFCAYTERFVKYTDSAHVEHFFPKKEYPNKIDDYYNWYVVIGWINENRPKKLTTKNGKTFLPIIMPYSEDFSERITYENEQFVPVDKKDEEVDNLIKFLSLNHFMLCKDRNAHIDYIRTLKSFFSKEEEFIEVLKSDKDNLSFATALQHELGIDVSKLL
jgi:hypothetical protein